MTLVVVVVLLAAFVLVVAGTVLIRSRVGTDLEPPAPSRARGATLLPPPEAPPDTQVHPPVAPVEAEGLADSAVTEAEVIEPLPGEPAVVIEPVPPLKPSIRDRLGRARSLLAGYVGSVLSRSSIDDEAWEELEEALIRADVGVGTTGQLLDALHQRVKAESLETPAQLVAGLKAQIKADLAGADRSLALRADTTNVWLFVGVNGVGKTTTIGKVALARRSEGNDVVLAAADTFRAAAAEQLEQWARRVGVDLVRGAEGGDPGSVVFDAVQRAASRGAQLVLADTAGRLHTKVNLMEELKKVRRVAERPPGAVTEVLLVIDATTGQNGLTQAREFAQAVGVTGVVLTKLDGTSKGGIVLAIEADLGVPVKLVGVGETADDLLSFDPEEFVDGLFE
ncbi:MAG TPA: signal recognition particle-docking protein FtsY [Acidimicrobiales bacterium]|nr:signal recognition particle-docking protein FtsY [Acidimicrobiales bacterium]